MKKNNINYLPVILIGILLYISLYILFPCNIRAEEYTSDVWTYTIEDGNAVITGYTGKAISKITIPSSLDGYKVVKLSKNCFLGNKKLIGIVTVPDTVIEIGEQAFMDSAVKDVRINNTAAVVRAAAFYGCESLTKVILPKSLKTLEENLFCKCTALAAVTIPDKVTTIKAGVFGGCDSLTSITVSKSVNNIDSKWLIDENESNYERTGHALQAIYVDSANKYFSSVSGILFSYDKKKIICFPCGKAVTKYTIPTGTCIIGEYCFENATKLTSIKLTDNVNSIETNAFSKCTKLTTIYVSAGNKNYTSDNGVLYKGTTLLVYPINKADSSYTVISGTKLIEESAFADNKRLEKVIIPKSVTEIRYCGFYNAAKLKTVSLSEGLTTIGAYAFDTCELLESIKLPTTLKELGEGAFEECRSLKSINIPNSVKIIKMATFLGCKSLTSITLPYTVESIGDEDYEYGMPGFVFAGCTRLTAVYVYNPMINIYGQTFTGYDGKIYGYSGSTVSKCNGFISLGYSGKLTDSMCWALNKSSGAMNIIGNGKMPDYTGFSKTPWYAYAKDIKKITVLKGITSIGNYAFNTCSNLKNVIGMEEVTSIGKYAFARCTSLESIEGCGKLVNLGIFAFDHAEALTTIGATKGTLNLSKVKSISTNCFYMCKSFQHLITGNALKSVGSYAFRSAMSMKTAVIGNNCETLGDYSFNACVNLNTITGCEGVTIIGKCTFNADSALATVGAVQNIVTFPALQVVAQYAFNNCNSMIQFVAGSKLTTIGAYTFNKCEKLIAICLMTNWLNKVGMYAFLDTYQYLYIYVPTVKLNAYGSIILRKGQAASASLVGY